MDIFLEPGFYDYYRKSPLTLVDIGARGGLQPNWRQANRFLKTIGFEPDPAEYRRLSETADANSVKFINAALSDGKNELDLYMTRGGGCISVFKPNRSFLDLFPESERFDIFEVAKIQTDTLDNQLHLNGIRDIDFIKIDTQGSELPILTGAAKSLKAGVFGMEVETLFAPIYENQTVFSDVDQFVRGFGYELFDIRPCYWKRTAGKRLGKTKGQLIFADALYFKNRQALKESLAGIRDEAELNSKILRTISICALYGYLDYALEIFEDHKSCFSDKEQKAVLRVMRGTVTLATRIPEFRGRGRIADLFYGIDKAVRPALRGWATGVKNLGNVD